MPIKIPIHKCYRNTCPPKYTISQYKIATNLVHFLVARRLAICSLMACRWELSTAISQNPFQEIALHWITFQYDRAPSHRRRLCHTIWSWTKLRHRFKDTVGFGQQTTPIQKWHYLHCFVVVWLVCFIPSVLFLCFSCVILLYFGIVWVLFLSFLCFCL